MLEEYMRKEEKRRKLNIEYLEKGVDFVDINTAYIEEGVIIEEGTLIGPCVTISGETVIGKDCFIGQNTVIRDSKIGNNVEIQSSVILESTIDDETKVGPFAYVRPNCTIGSKCKVGDFVEMKNSSFGNGSKASHLTYVGDSDVGEGVNLGCGVVFVNYNGTEKFRSTVGNNAFIGCNSNLVSPVNIGEGAYIAAGSTVTDNVKDDSLYVARARGVEKEGWVSKSQILKKKKK